MLKVNLISFHILKVFNPLILMIYDLIMIYKNKIFQHDIQQDIIFN